MSGCGAGRQRYGWPWKTSAHFSTVDVTLSRWYATSKSPALAFHVSSLYPKPLSSKMRAVPPTV